MHGFILMILNGTNNNYITIGDLILNTKINSKAAILTLALATLFAPLSTANAAETYKKPAATAPEKSPAMTPSHEADKPKPLVAAFDHVKECALAEIRYNAALDKAQLDGFTDAREGQNLRAMKRKLEGKHCPSFS